MSSPKQIKEVFLASIEDVDNLEAFKRLIDRTKADSEKHIPNINTRMQLYSFIRTRMKKRYGEGSPEYIYLKNLTISDEEHRQRRREALDRVTEANDDQKVIKKETLYEFVRDLLNNPTIIDRLIFLQLACGSRFVEIVHPDFRFSKCEDVEGFITQSSVAKSKEAFKSVTKPLLFIQPDMFLSELKLARSELKVDKDTSYSQATERYGQRVNTIIKRISEGIGLPIKSSHDLRRVYANLSFELYARKQKNISHASWLKLVLGHSDYTSTANYSTFKIES